MSLPRMRNDTSAWRLCLRHQESCWGNGLLHHHGAACSCGNVSQRGSVCSHFHLRDALYSPLAASFPNFASECTKNGMFLIKSFSSKQWPDRQPRVLEALNTKEVFKQNPNCGNKLKWLYYTKWNGANGDADSITWPSILNALYTRVAA